MKEDKFIKSIDSCNRIVRRLLLQYPPLRDSDADLILNVWVEQFPSLKNGSFRSFADVYRTGNIYPPETIRRTRQKLQEEVPELRGDVYNVRHGIQEVTREKIKELRLF